MNPDYCTVFARITSDSGRIITGGALAKLERPRLLGWFEEIFGRGSIVGSDGDATAKRTRDRPAAIREHPYDLWR